MRSRLARDHMHHGSALHRQKPRGEVPHISHLDGTVSTERDIHVFRLASQDGGVGERARPAADTLQLKQQLAAGAITGARHLFLRRRFDCEPRNRLVSASALTPGRAVATSHNVPISSRGHTKECTSAAMRCSYTSSRYRRDERPPARTEATNADAS